MTRPIQLDKTYGVLHTESFFSFLGFAKKIGSDEIQKIDVFLDDKLIDTIEANEFIQKIDDMYDVESKAFTYNLQIKYIGLKSTISFKNHDSGKELLNSPYTLIDKNHEKFNEASFMHSLSEPLSEELKNMYKPNCIGFLATKENLEDEDFMNYIKDLMEKFPDVEFKEFYFNYTSNKTNSVQINTSYDITKNCCILITNPELINNRLDQIITQQQIKFQNVYISPFYKTHLNNKIKDIVMPNFINAIKNNLDIFTLSENDIKEISNNHILMVRRSFEKLLNLEVINKTVLLNISFKELQFINITETFKNRDFVKVQKYLTSKLLELSK